MLFRLEISILQTQPWPLAIGASLSFVMLAFVALMAGAGRTEGDAPEISERETTFYTDTVISGDEEVADVTDEAPRARTSDLPDQEDPPAPDITADEDPLN